MNEKHTPGANGLPWIWDGAEGSIKDCDDNEVLTAWSRGKSGPPRLDFNARKYPEHAYLLRACNAFPDLLAACEAVVGAIAISPEVHSGPVNWFKLDKSLKAALERARACIAIAKAKGETKESEA